MPPDPMDFEKLLRFFQNTYAHALTLQEIIETQANAEVRYELLKEKYDRLAAEKFEMFYKALNEPQVFAKAVKEFLDMQSKTGNRA